MKFKDKTRGGYTVEILTTDLSGNYPVGAKVTNLEGRKKMMTYTADGKLLFGKESPNDLIPIPDYSDFRKGDLCWVWDYDHNRHRLRFFERPDEVDGGVYARTNPGGMGLMHWDHCEKVFQPLSDERIKALWNMPELLNADPICPFARLIEKEIMNQVKT